MPTFCSRDPINHEATTAKPAAMRLNHQQVEYNPTEWFHDGRGRTNPKSSCDCISGIDLPGRRDDCRSSCFEKKCKCEQVPVMVIRRAAQREHGFSNWSIGMENGEMPFINTTDPVVGLVTWWEGRRIKCHICEPLMFET